MSETNSPGSPAADETQQRRQAVRRARMITVIVLVLLVIGAGRTVMSRISNANVLEARTEEAARLYVRTAYPKAAGEGYRAKLGEAVRSLTAFCGEPRVVHGTHRAVQPAARRSAPRRRARE